jgi:hypothetical protein
MVRKVKVLSTKELIEKDIDYLRNNFIESIEIFDETDNGFFIEINVSLIIRIELPLDSILYRNINSFSELKEEFKKQTINDIIKYLKE